MANGSHSEITGISSALTTNTSVIKRFEMQMVSKLSDLETLVQEQHQAQNENHIAARNMSTATVVQTASNLQSQPMITVSSRHVRPQSTSCGIPWCTCSCHQPGSFSTPDFMRQLVGKMLITYSDVPNLNPQCTQSQCKKRRRFPSFRVSYYFPRWLWGLMVTTHLAYTSRDGLELHRLRTPRIIPIGSKIFTLAQTGDLEAIRSLFTQGLASPYDVDQDGLSALWVWSILCNLLIAPPECKAPTEPFAACSEQPDQELHRYLSIDDCGRSRPS